MCLTDYLAGKLDLCLGLGGVKPLLVVRRPPALDAVFAQKCTSSHGVKMTGRVPHREQRGRFGLIR